MNKPVKKGVNMKKSKKLISIILAVVLTISVVTTAFVVSANAKKATISITVDKTQISAGQSATVSVNVDANFPIATMSIPVFYDKTLVTVSDATANLTSYAVSSTTTDEQSVDSDKVYANTGVSSTKFGFVLVNYIGGAEETVPETTNSVVLTFKITAKEDVSGEAVVKCVSESAKTDDNVAGMLYFGSTTSGTTIDSIPENIENIDVTSAITGVKIGSSDTTLMVEEGFEYADYVVIDTNNNNYGEFTGIVYGIDTLDQNNYFEALATLDDALTTNNGDDYLVIEANDQGVESTGAKITVVDENGDALETYYFVYFGDIDGDGMVTAGDGFYAELYEMETTGIESFAQYVSADVDVDGMVTAGDGFYTELFEMEGDGMEYQYVLAETASGNEYEWISE